MNFGLLLALLKGNNIWQTISKVLTVAGGLIAGLDADNTGTDDTIAGIMLSAADGLDAYGHKDYNRAGQIIDGVIAGLQRLKAEWLTAGVIKPHVEEPAK